MEEVPVYSVDSGPNVHGGDMGHRKREDDVPRTCRCLNVPAVTLSIAIFFLILYIFVLSLNVGLLVFDPDQEYSMKASVPIIVLAAVNILLLLLMILGCAKEKPACLKPFLVLRICEFCIYCLTVLWFYLRYVIKGIWNSPDLDISLPDEYLGIHPELVSFLIWILGALRVYIIWVIWECYKYLKLIQNDRASRDWRPQRKFHYNDNEPAPGVNFRV
ncbi:Lysosomal-associated transmembrane protein 5 [Orchesella cincta]|uniref:Lysosomal-associated transmembrane protein 5 n=1 Tax=Orchesella cincta TaxID=48709 RepID=A0A1D2MUT6_ORCCI|nr:Lysosomal-associated transmembrane protein 5 [Orchesella cincta]